MESLGRTTKAKTAVAQALKLSAYPITQEDIFERVRLELPDTAYSTVYRIIQKFESEGLVHRIDWRERGARYEWSERPHHHHLVCQNCGDVVDLSDADVHYDDSLVANKTGFVITDHSVELSGICQKCQQKETHD